MGIRFEDEQKPLPPDRKDECLQLKAIFNSRKRDLGLTQEKLAHLLGINQSSVSHYLNGVNPLNAQAAAAFAEILQVHVREFSPRLADEITDMAKTLRPAPKAETEGELTPMSSFEVGTRSTRMRLKYRTSTRSKSPRGRSLSRP